MSGGKSANKKETLQRKTADITRHTPKKLKQRNERIMPNIPVLLQKTAGIGEKRKDCLSRGRKADKMRKRLLGVVTVLLCVTALMSIAVSVYTLVITARSIAEKGAEQEAVTETQVEQTEPERIVKEKPAGAYDLPVIYMQAVVTIIEEEQPVSVQPLLNGNCGKGGFITDGKNDLELVAIAIYKEAGGDDCSDETRIMVGNVIINRTNHEEYPDTVEGVLLQRRQYNTFYWTGVVWPERASLASEQKAVERAYACAERVLLGEKLLEDDVIYQAEFFQGTELVCYQDGIYFCR